MGSPPATPRRPKERRREIWGLSTRPVGFSRRWRHEADASPPPLRPYIRIFVTKHAFPALAAPAASKRGFVRWRREPKPRLFRLPAPALAKILISIPPAWRSPCRARADESEPRSLPRSRAPIRPNIVVAAIREAAGPAFRDRGAAARRRGGFRGHSAAFDDFGARVRRLASISSAAFSPAKILFSHV